MAALLYDIVQPPKDTRNTLVIALSARALFDLETEDRVFQEHGLEAYIQYMVEREDVILPKGPAFEFVRSALAVNDHIRELDPKDIELFDIVIVSRNHTQAAVRLINSINHYGLCLERLSLTEGTDPTTYLEAWKVDLFLSPEEGDVRRAIQAGYPAAVVYQSETADLPHDQLRIVFDGDAVLFSDEAERVYQEGGFPLFFQNETVKVSTPLDEGPMTKFALRMSAMQQKFHKKRVPCPIRTYLLTARSGASTGKRAILTLRHWCLQIDECNFNAGAGKGAMLRAIRPHLYLDDSQRNIDAALQENICAARVLYGVQDKGTEREPTQKALRKKERSESNGEK
ncbi:cytosolic 5'-nucleotidase 1A-like [Branchiostoma floridae]|uniref:Cytosolic 5'-nucleotidase 1A-like n=1 Tax=Branchiostoma floridae TaxID=7739 RepID=A0A9J7M0B8_BRAFL|nr:cytosolic 5'-nucleotidase 1A-like [Branchiostoma floridae]XP_035692395.1 cytosolic 5'-nucleotidase 1A-like [Branchiostoma floridae]XP_035692396.1 cytosolic 5'-nucleotidase 1A-like [Branchiostoma floridae]